MQGSHSACAGRILPTVGYMCTVDYSSTSGQDAKFYLLRKRGVRKVDLQENNRFGSRYAEVSLERSHFQIRKKSSLRCVSCFSVGVRYPATFFRRYWRVMPKITSLLSA